VIPAALEFARLYPVIRGVVHLLCWDHAAADDVTQEAAIRVLVLWYRFVPPPGATVREAREARREWAATIAFYVVQERRSRDAAQKRAAALVTDPAKIEATVHGHVPSAESVAIGEETVYELEHATTPLRWYVFWTRHVEGLTAGEIAMETRAPLGTVYTWLRAAAKDMRTFLLRRRGRS
jgi:DNA-directed RNA polymerase specialized sigma24 family protein